MRHGGTFLFFIQLDIPYYTIHPVSRFCLRQANWLPRIGTSQLQHEHRFSNFRQRKRQAVISLNGHVGKNISCMVPRCDIGTLKVFFIGVEDGDFFTDFFDQSSNAPEYFQFI